MAQQQQNQSSSRLHRLLTLLDTGSTQATRFAAARQIGDIARTHPEDLNSLLKKVSHYLRSRNWDTRVASAQAIGSIAEKLKLTSFSDLCSFLRARISSSSPWSCANDIDNIRSLLGLSATRVASLSFRSFDLNKVLDFGALLASGGQEYDVAVDSAKSPRERLARQKKSLKRRLGLDGCEQFMDVNEMISDEDLVHGFNFAGGGSSGVQLQLQGRAVRSFRSKRPSARELNLLKRKAKVSSKDPPVKGWSEEPPVVDGGSNSGMAGTPRGLAPDSSSKFDSNSLDDDAPDNDVEGRWPFIGFVEQLLVDMFDPVWEIRHGSIMALREIFTYQGSCVGVHSPDSSLSDQILRDLAVSSITVSQKEEVESGMQAGGQELQSNDFQMMNLGAKRESFVDGNVQIAGEEDPQQVFKRQKVVNSSVDTSGQIEHFCLDPQDIHADQNLGHPDIKPDFTLNSQVIHADQNLDINPDFSLNSHFIGTDQNLGHLDIKPDISLNSEGHLDFKPDFTLNSQAIASDHNLGHADIKSDFCINSQFIAADQNLSHLDFKPDFSLNSQVSGADQNLGHVDIKQDFSLNSQVIAADQNLGLLDIKPDFSLSSEVIASDQNIGHADIKLDFSLSSEVIASDQNLSYVDIKPEVSHSSHVTAADQNLGPVDINTEPNLDGSKLGTMCLDIAETISLEKVKQSTYHKTDLIRDLTSNHQLLSLVKLTQHSWLRNSEFLLDCAVRFLCVLCLDRFGDYVSDQVVAPVRETCAQALGAVLKYMPPELVCETLNILLQMQSQADWEIRHGSLLGIKYLVAVRRELLSSLLGRVIPACKAGLGDPDDDVRAVAADALIPAAAAIVSMKGYTLHSIVMLLWDILLDLDDLSPSTSSVMNLLAEIYSNEDMIPNMLDALAVKEDDCSMPDLNEVSLQDDFLGGFEGTLSQENPYSLSALAPRLWPFMRHSITSVRHSAIRTLERLLEAGYRRQASESSSDCGSFWPASILGDTLRIVFQNLLLESNESILQSTERVWRLLLQCPVKDLEAAASCYISSWLELVTTPYGSSLDASKMFWPVTPSRKSHYRPAAKMRALRPDGDSSRSSGTEDSNGYMSSSSVKMVIGSDLDKSVTHTRVVASTAVGILASKWPAESIQFMINPLWSNLVSVSGVQRQVASMVIISWFQEMKKGSTGTTCEVHPALSDQFKKWLLELLSCTDPSFPTKGSPYPYFELSRTYTKMRSEANHLLHAIKSNGIYALLPGNDFDIDKLSVDGAISFASNIHVPSKDINSMEVELPTEDVGNEVETLKQKLLTTSGYLKCVQNNLHIAVAALIASAVVWMSDLPVKLNPIILPLMTSIKREQEEVLQQKAAEALAELIFQCVTRKPGPNEKLIKNLCSCTCMDPLETPQAGIINSVETIEEQDLLSFKSMAGSTTQKSRNRASGGGGEDRSKTEGFISRRGAELALKYLCEKFGGFLFEKIPKLWDCLTEVLKPINSGDEADQRYKVNLAIDSVKDPQILINNLQLIRSTAPLLDDKLKSELLSLLPCIFKCVRHPHVAVRLAASRCIASIAKSMIVHVMGVVVENAVPMLGDGASVPARQGAGMLVSLLVQALGGDLVPYAPLLVVPLLRCMSDSDPSVRQSVTRSFAALVPLLPLARGLPPPAGLSEALTRDKEDARFLEQLLDSSSIEDYKLCTDLKVTLRRYQQEGVNWLAFLKRFKLHGILCDDMGLGKTLQASAIVASDIAENRQAVDNGREELPPSLIICPSTLVGHWAYEIEKYIDVSLIRTLQYVGSTQERISLRSYFDKYNVIITSYDVVRKDIDYFANLLWNYCILDEGHVIKNARSKITAAVKQLKAQHRLILSGTPIQNNILDLWSLFDFLMPGFLGSERQFQGIYGKPLVAARDAKCSAKDAEAGVLAMEALHKQVMPFLLRRTKAEVLSDLPEKIIQDRFCDLSPVQLKLYEQYSGSHAKQEISGLVKLDDSSTSSETKADNQPKATAHVFQALQYLLKLCSHPLLVVGDKVPESVRNILSELYPESQDAMSELHRLHHSPKLVALQEILEECGVGVDASGSEGGMVSIGQHRVLVFAQHKALLDIIERDLFQTHMKSITYMRLDGSVHPEKRFDIVKTFNSDPTIDVLLLTTHVGGLGLNLTSADTLVFMEHDWNPMRDHQAMDRAHRLGQKRVVNVHRLIMRGTLEEKVMSLQRFKVSVANTVINSENASLKTMNTDQLLDLFTPAENAKKVGGRSLHNQDGSGQKPSGSGKGLKAILNGLEELWDQSQYTEEYNLDQFLTKLNG